MPVAKAEAGYFLVVLCDDDEPIFRPVIAWAIDENDLEVMPTAITLLGVITDNSGSWCIREPSGQCVTSRGELFNTVDQWKSVILKARKS